MLLDPSIMSVLGESAADPAAQAEAPAEKPKVDCGIKGQVRIQGINNFKHLKSDAVFYGVF